MTATPSASPPVSVRVNGDPHTVPGGSTVSDLLTGLDLDPRLVVVERNRNILRDPSTFGEVTLGDGDVLELVHFVGGG